MNVTLERNITIGIKEEVDPDNLKVAKALLLYYVSLINDSIT